MYRFFQRCQATEYNDATDQEVSLCEVCKGGGLDCLMLCSACEMFVHSSCAEKLSKASKYLLPKDCDKHIMYIGNGIVCYFCAVLLGVVKE